MRIAGFYRPAGSTLSAVFALFLCATVALTQGRNVPVPSGHSPVYDELAKAPEKDRSRPNPLEGDADAPVAGKKLFQDHCAECHGEDAAGGKRAPGLRAEEVQQSTPGTLFWILTNGVVRHGMPVWSKLPEPQRWQIVTYLKSLGVTRSQMAPPSAR
ncbi:MAG: c-type cytochrome [Candidatus Acidiferrales bacterium]